jgi:hypothetical protein
MAEARQPPDLRQDFLAWARISARLLRRPVAERVRIMRDTGVAGIWQEADAHWFDILIEDLRSGHLNRLQQYMALCADSLRQQGDKLASPCEELRKATGPYGTAPIEEPNVDGVPRFARKLAAARPPVPPETDQVETRVFLDDMREEALSIAMAMDWPLSTYTWLCAELAYKPERAAEVWKVRGIHTPNAQHAVIAAWEERLRDDEHLRAKHDALLKRYLAGLTSR